MNIQFFSFSLNVYYEFFLRTCFCQDLLSIRFMERGAEFFFTSFTRQASLIEEPLDFCVWKRNKGEA